MDAVEFNLSTRRDWRSAFSALSHLLSDANDTAQVFRIMRSLNAGSAKKGYNRLLQTLNGGEIAYRRVELAERLSNQAFIAGFADGSLGAAYCDFLERTGHSAQGLAAISRSDDAGREAEHPYAWFNRRMRDTHDVWHILTGYRADDPLGEACLVAFSYAQTGGLGWALIAVAAALSSLRLPGGLKGVRAIWEGYINGRRAAWLPGTNYETLLSVSVNVARYQLNIYTPRHYDSLINHIYFVK